MDEATYKEALRWKHSRFMNPTQEDFDAMLAEYIEHGKGPSGNDYHYRERVGIARRIMYHLSRGHLTLKIAKRDTNTEEIDVQNRR